MIKYNVHKGFTLSEVLLVLSVIGVVAALTIPTLTQKVGNDQLVVQLKKNYSVLSQAVNMMIANNEIETAFAGPDAPSTDANAMNTMVKYVNVIKNCGSAVGCLYNTPLKYNNGNTYLSTLDTTIGSAKATLADGSMIFIDTYGGGITCGSNRGNGPLQTTCGLLFVDVNGAKGPNTMGKDFFAFWMTTTGLFPKGSYSDSHGRACGESANIALDTGCTADILAQSVIN